ncbi:hypothetical protein [Massilia sp. SYSU DXS3249]
MKFMKKHAAGAQQLHAALAETDPTSVDLILLDRAGFRPAFRLPPMPHMPGFARRPVATPAARDARGRTPAARAHKKTTARPV